MTVGRKIVDKNLKALSVFGSKCIEDKQLSQGAGNVENVDIIAQGKFVLEPTGKPDEFILRADHLLTRKGFTGNYGEGYEPILAARWIGDGRANGGIINARLGIYPIKGRVIRDDAWI